MREVVPCGIAWTTTSIHNAMRTLIRPSLFVCLFVGTLAATDAATLDATQSGSKKGAATKTTKKGQAGTKTAPNLPAKPPAGFAQQGKPYWIGKGEPLVLTLNRVELSVGRFNYGEDTVAPKSEEKLVLVRFTVKNSGSSPATLDSNSLSISAVDADGTTHVGIESLVREGKGEAWKGSLKPKESVDLVTAILAPGEIVVPKLIIARGSDSAPLRFNLTNEVRGIPAPAGNASDRGLTAPPEVAGAPGAFFPLENFDARFESFQPGEGNFGNLEFDPDEKWGVATFTLKNGTKTSQPYGWSRFRALMVDSREDETVNEQMLLKATSDEAAEGNLPPSGEVKVRFFFRYKADQKVQKIGLREGESRTYFFQVPG